MFRVSAPCFCICRMFGNSAHTEHTQNDTAGPCMEAYLIKTAESPTESATFRSIHLFLYNFLLFYNLYKFQLMNADFSVQYAIVSPY